MGWLLLQVPLRLVMVADSGLRGAHYVALSEHYAAPADADGLAAAVADGASDVGAPSAGSMRSALPATGRPILGRAEGAELVTAAREIRTALYVTAAAVVLAAAAATVSAVLRRSG